MLKRKTLPNKVLLGAVFILGLIGISFLATLIFFFSQVNCGEGYQNHTPSQSGENAIIAKWKDCGATTSRSSTYYVLPSRGKELRDVNFAEISKATAFLQIDGAVTVEWASNDTVVVTLEKGNPKLLRNEINGTKIIIQAAAKN